MELESIFLRFILYKCIYLQAIDWLHKNLQKNPNFGSEVTKEQTIQLLKKLHRAGIIENVKDDSSEEEFKISGELYR